MNDTRNDGSEHGNNHVVHGVIVGKWQRKWKPLYSIWGYILGIMEQKMEATI